jgi:hypothetical protein
VLISDLLGRRLAASNPGTVDQDVDLAERSFGGGKKSFNICLRRNVPLHRVAQIEAQEPLFLLTPLATSPMSFATALGCDT